MISFDVESLFINILLDECIDLAVRVTHFYFTLALLRFGGHSKIEGLKYFLLKVLLKERAYANIPPGSLK